MSVDVAKPIQLLGDGSWLTHSHGGEDILELVDKRYEGWIVDIDPIEWSVRVHPRRCAGTHE